ncbi:hypothetical protein FRAAL1182 [Frankia alni ACN14a]|uniref:Uncharacterized protein n=1 Tax=Frankia alni (strain DSM 45986 / CECT 9034 / ACN14a) TaxID=326424 RepID=Q0RRH5_FRAAA|nr:hypothetical protein FRAAL1182 [Frankia alni ACN14a]
MGCSGRGATVSAGGEWSAGSDDPDSAMGVDAAGAPAGPDDDPEHAATTSGRIAVSRRQR